MQIGTSTRRGAGLEDDDLLIYLLGIENGKNTRIGK